LEPLEQRTLLATVSFPNSTTLRYTDALGETNNLTISQAGDTYTISDTGATISAPAPCAGSGTATVTCNVAGIALLDVLADDQSDTISITASRNANIMAGTGDDTVTADSGNDTISGSLGNDCIVSGSGDDQLTGGRGRDTLDGGSGNDTLRGDSGSDPSNLLLVSNTDTGTRNVLSYDANTGGFLAPFVVPASGGLDRPIGLAVGPDGNLSVSSAGTSEILRYDGSTGSFLDPGELDGQYLRLWAQDWESHRPWNKLFKTADCTAGAAMDMVYRKPPAGCRCAVGCTGNCARK
jgi:Ca2+-binding RTX toxin-like protein